MRLLCFCISLVVLLTSVSARAESSLRAEGWKLYQEGEFNRAIAAFQKMQQPDQKPDSQIEGLYGEASCWNYRQDGRKKDKAGELYEKILQKDPTCSLAPWAALELIRVKNLGVIDNYANTAEIAQAYRTVYEKFPESDAGHEAYLVACNLESATAKQEELEALQKKILTFLEAHPQSHYRSNLYLVLANCSRSLNKPEEQLYYSEKILETQEFDPANPNANSAELIWTMAYVAEFEIGDLAKAREYYGRLLKDYPRDLRIFAVRKALNRMNEIEAAIRENRPIPSNLIEEKSK